MSRSLAGRSALVVGGSRGIGRAVATAFGEAGAALTLVARSRNQVMQAAEEIARSTRGRANGLVADIASFREAQTAVDKHLADYGSLDVVVNAAAILGPIGPLWQNQPEEWERAVKIGLVGSFNICRAAVPGMLAHGKGVIILFSGGGGAYARPYFSAYGVSKTGVLRLVETLALELRDSGVTAYAISPGAARTAMTEEILANAQEAGESAAAEARQVLETGGVSPGKAGELCLFLVQEQPRHLSGTLLHVNEPYRTYAGDGGKPGGEESGFLRRVPFGSTEGQS